MAQFVAALDFDGVIHNPDDREPGRRMGRPYPGAKEAISRLKELGAKIVIHTCRARPTEFIDGELWENGTQHVADWLTFFEIPYDQITSIKPLADVYLDDRAVPFDGDWQHAEREILSMFYLGVR